MNQVAVIDQAELNALISELGGGVTQEQDTIKVPFMKFQYEPEDAQGRDVKRGTIFLSDQPEPVYADSVKLHVMAQYYQYRQTDPDTYKIVNKTILLEDLRRGEPRDMLGGIRCGRPTGKALGQMSDEDQKMWRAKVKPFRILRGVTSYTGKTADGKEVEVTNQPFQLYMKGLSFMKFDDVLKALPYGKRYQDLWVDLHTSKEGKAFVANFAIDFAKPAAMTQEVVDSMKLFVEMARQENSKIEESFRSAKAAGALDDQIYDNVSDDLDQDFA